MKRIFVVILCFFLSPLFAEKLMIGVSADDPPFSSRAGCEECFYGFEIDLMLGICQRIGAECHFIYVVAEQLLEGLFTSKINLAMSAAIDTGETLNIPIQFSLPYFPSSAQFLVKRQSNINRLEDLENKRVGIRIGALYRGKYFQYIVYKLLNYHVQTVLYRTMNELYDALLLDRLDAVFANTEPLKYWQANNSSYYRLIGSPIMVGKGYAVVGKDTDSALLQRIDQALLSMQKDGTYQKIYNLYFSSI